MLPLVSMGAFDVGLQMFIFEVSFVTTLIFAEEGSLVRVCFEMVLKSYGAIECLRTTVPGALQVLQFRRKFLACW